MSPPSDPRPDVLSARDRANSIACPARAPLEVAGARLDVADTPVKVADAPVDHRRHSDAGEVPARGGHVRPQIPADAPGSAEIGARACVPLEVRIGSVTVHAASAGEGRTLADALPAALERALEAAVAAGATPSPGTPPATVIDAGAVGPAFETRDLAGSLARLLVETAFRGEPLR